MVTTGNLPIQGRAGNRTRDLVICSQKLWPLDHEAILNLDMKWRSEVNIWPRPLYLVGRMGGPHSRCGSFGEEKNHFPLVGEPRIVQPTAQSAYRLRYPGYPVSTFGNFYGGHTCSMNGAVSLLWQHPHYRRHKKRFLLEDHNAGSNVRFSGWYSCFVFGEVPRVEISVRRPFRDRGSVWFSSVRPTKYWDKTLNYALRDSSHHSTLYQLCSSESAV